MKKTIFILTLISIYSIPVFASGEINSYGKKLHKIHHDIVLLNLINGLYLNQKQANELMKKIETAEEVREHFFEKMKEHENEIEEVLKTVRQVLLKGDEITEALKKQVRRMKEIQHDLEDERGGQLLQLESEINDLLTPNQPIIIDEYKPCTVPPALGKIGQSVDLAVEGIVRHLSRIRNMPPDRFEMMKGFFINKHVEKIERHEKVMDVETKGLHREKMLALFEKARTMTDKEFMLRKADLARNILPEDTKLQPRKKNQLSKIGRFLLDPALFPLLKERIKTM